MAGRRRPTQLPEPEKPLTEMTPEELAEHVRDVCRTLRDDQVRRGTRPPKTMRETKIWLDELAAKEDRAAKRIARAERRQGGRAEPRVQTIGPESMARTKPGQGPVKSPVQRSKP